MPEARSNQVVLYVFDLGLVVDVVGELGLLDCFVREQDLLGQEALATDSDVVREGDLTGFSELVKDELDIVGILLRQLLSRYSSLLQLLLHPVILLILCELVNRKQHVSLDISHHHSDLLKPEERR